MVTLQLDGVSSGVVLVANRQYGAFRWDRDARALVLVPGLASRMAHLPRPISASRLVAFATRPLEELLALVARRLRPTSGA